MNGKGSKRRPGKPGAYEAGWARIFKERKGTPPRKGCVGRTGCHNPATEEHTCPYATEINDDNRLCTCCADCQHECAMDI